MNQTTFMSLVWKKSGTFGVEVTVKPSGHDSVVMEFDQSLTPEQGDQLAQELGLNHTYHGLWIGENVVFKMGRSGNRICYFENGVK